MYKEIVELINREPFVPFRIVLTSGDRFQVDNPNLVALGQSVLHLMFPKSDRYTVIRFNQIAATEVLEPAA